MRRLNRYHPSLTIRNVGERRKSVNVTVVLSPRVPTSILRPVLAESLAVHVLVFLLPAESLCNNSTRCRPKFVTIRDGSNTAAGTLRREQRVVERSCTRCVSIEVVGGEIEALVECWNATPVINLASA